MNILDQIEDLLKKVSDQSLGSADEAENFRIRYLGKKGLVAKLFSEFRSVPDDKKKLVGQKINLLKESIQNKLNEFKETREHVEVQSQSDDLSLPGSDRQLGSRHPVSIVNHEIITIFSHLGFVVSEGPEIEDDNHVFTKLNFVPDHPARDMQDTFFIHKKHRDGDSVEDILLRTHTSSVQVRVMENQKPPIRTISPGRVFRNEAISARAHCIFHQVEGLYIDENVSFADLKQTLVYFSKEMFGADTKIRLRPSFFPFTEPSAELDVSCTICSGKGCNVCKYTGWLEVLGCGMVDPNVLENCGIDSVKYTGFAFGMGVERVAMLKYSVNDLRLYFENDLRFLEQFSHSI